MKKQAKSNLPKVWVLLGGPEPYAFSTKAEAVAAVSTDFETVRQYAPFKPPRRCVWVERPGVPDDYKTGCGLWLENDGRFDFCPYCGGRIVGLNTAENRRRKS